MKTGTTEAEGGGEEVKTERPVGAAGGCTKKPNTGTEISCSTATSKIVWAEPWLRHGCIIVALAGDCGCIMIEQEVTIRSVQSSPQLASATTVTPNPKRKRIQHVKYMMEETATRKHCAL
jgi:hypothetical protein